jgi:cytochrome c biogenesis protein CcmG/thiol:disulfide interchange protein DsbE
MSGPAKRTVSGAAKRTDENRRRRHSARWIAGGVLVCGVALVIVLATRPTYGATEVWTPLLGKQAPAVHTLTLNGQAFDLSQDRGRWVVVNFFASWCAPCQQEQPDLVTFAYQHQSAGDAALVSIVFNDSDGAARAYQRQTGATWPTLSDPGSRIALSFGVRGQPETFIVSPSGQVVAHIDGAMSTTYLDTQLSRAESAA